MHENSTILDNYLSIYVEDRLFSFTEDSEINNKNENNITLNINFGTLRAFKIKGNFKSISNLLSAEKWNNLRDPLACQQKGYVNVSSLN